MAPRSVHADRLVVDVSAIMKELERLSQQGPDVDKKALRKRYSKVFKLLRLAVKNSSEGEAQAAIRAAQKLITQLDEDLVERLARVNRGPKK